MAAAFHRTTRALSLDSSRVAIASLGIAAIALAAWLTWFFGAGVTLYELSREARIEVASAPRDVAVGEGGRLMASRLAISRRVRAGEVLAVMDDDGQRLRLADAERRLRDYPIRIASLDRELAALDAADTQDRGAAEAAARAATARLAEAGAAVRAAAALARRQTADAAAGGVSRAEADRATDAARGAEAAEAAAAAEAQRLRFDVGTRRDQIAARGEELARSRLALAAERDATEVQRRQLLVALDRRVLRAPVSGVIAEAAPIRPGAVVTAGQRLATVVPVAGEMIVVASFDPATALGRIRAGQAATLRLAGYPWAQYGAVRAVVRQVSGEVREGKLRVELGVLPGGLRHLALAHGLAGTVEVAVDRVSPATLLLRSLGRMS